VTAVDIPPPFQPYDVVDDVFTQVDADARYAFGIVARGSLVSGSPLTLPVNVETKVTSDLNCLLTNGRTYRVNLLLRAVVGTSAAGFIDIRLRNGTTLLFSNSPLILLQASNYGLANYSWLLVGDGASKTLNVVLFPYVAASVYTETAGWFYVEDLGIL
jgi:hypothetical protein